MGPPKLPPNVLKLFGALLSNPNGVASSALFCRYSNNFPCGVLLRLLIAIVTSATCENSALLNDVTLNSEIRSDEEFRFASATLARSSPRTRHQPNTAPWPGVPPPIETLPLLSRCTPGAVVMADSRLVVAPR
jgi:hypothetical protein